MAAISRLKYIYLAYLLNPKYERTLYRQIQRRRIGRIVELGIGSAARSARIIEVAQRYAPGGRVDYTGLDLFDARPASSPGLSLKEAHRLLHATGARVRLVPGDPHQGLTATANALAGTDLLLMPAEFGSGSESGAWFYVPRMLHDGSLVLREKRGEGIEPALEPVPRSEIDRLAQARSRRRAA